MDGHKTTELLLDILDHPGRSRRHNCDARGMRGVVALGNGETFDVVTAAGEQTDGAGEYTGRVVDENGDGMALNGNLLLNDYPARLTKASYPRPRGALSLLRL